MTVNAVVAATRSGNVSALQSLGAAVSDFADEHGATAVHYAARSGQLEVLKWLVTSAHVDGSTKTNSGCSPLHDAAATGQLDCLKWLAEERVRLSYSMQSSGAWGNPLFVQVTCDA